MRPDGSSDAHVAWVTGKGGVGKTTVALALGRLYAARGRRALVLDLGAGLGLSAATGRAAGHEPGPIADVPVGGSLEVASTDAERAVDDLVLSASPSRRIATRLLRLASLRAFLGAAPGVLEVALLTRLDVLAKCGRYDAIVVDADASGHVQMLLDTPALLRKVGAAGPVARALDAAAARLVDPARTTFHVVTLPTSLALEETRTLARSLRERAAPLGTLFVTRAPEPLVIEPSTLELAAARARATAAEEDVAALVGLVRTRARLDPFVREEGAAFQRVVELPEGADVERWVGATA